jgi:hypothetical protein
MWCLLRKTGVAGPNRLAKALTERKIANQPTAMIMKTNRGISMPERSCRNPVGA